MATASWHWHSLGPVSASPLHGRELLRFAFPGSSVPRGAGIAAPASGATPDPRSLSPRNQTADPSIGYFSPDQNENRTSTRPRRWFCADPDRAARGSCRACRTCPQPELSDRSHGHVRGQGSGLGAHGSSPGGGSDPRFEPVLMTRWCAAPDQAHIRSPLVAAAPTSRIRRVGLRRPGPFCRSAGEASGRFGSPT